MKTTKVARQASRPSSCSLQASEAIDTDLVISYRFNVGSPGTVSITGLRCMNRSKPPPGSSKY